MTEKKPESKLELKKPNVVIPKEEKKEEASVSVAWLIAGILGVIIVILAAVLVTKGHLNLGSGSLSWSSNAIIKADVAQEKVADYVNNEILQGQATAEIKDIKSEKGLYKFTVAVEGEEFDSYVTQDGSLLFPTEGVDMSEVEDTAAATEESDTDATAEIEKADNVTAYLFTMSYCPYGNQAEAAMIPVAELLGDKENVTIEPHYVIYSNYQGGGSDYCLDEESKYCSMHGIQELNQDVRELCAYKYEPTKYWDFIDLANKNCTYKNVDECWEEQATSAGLDVNQIKTCESDEALDLLATEVELGEKYGVKGSPHLVINESKFTGSRTAEGYKDGICSGLNEQLEECSQELDSEAATAEGSCD